MNRPLFKAVTKVIDSGLVYAAGQTFELRDWPNSHSGEMVPLNVEAQRILDYARHRHSRGYPARLMRNDGSIFLPAHPGSHVSWRNPAPAEVNPRADMPRYRVQGRIVLGGIEHHSGEEIAYLGWPGALGLLPVNAIAKRIADFEEANSDHLLHAPWCCLRDACYLPDSNGVDLAQVLAPYRQPPPRPHRMKVSRARGTAPRVSAA
jgi:hypothetical protein